MFSLIAIATVLFLVPTQSLQQGFVNSPSATIEITKTGLDVAKSYLQKGERDDAKYAINFSSEYFSRDLVSLRGSDAGLTDDIHVSLLDLPSSVDSDHSNSVESIDSISAKLDGYSISEDDSDLIILDMLSIADEQYVTAISEGSSPAYEISKELFQKSKQFFEENADLEVMLDLEQQSFFNDIEAAIGNRDSFVKVGTLVSAIQRDLVGTQTMVYDQRALYDKIRSLYAQLLEAAEAGDYDRAEEYAIEAYLDSFEYLEPALEAADADFMYSLEIRMREDLRDMIKRGEPVPEIRGFLESSILPDLSEGEAKATAYLENNPLGIANAAGRELKDRGESTEEEQSEVRDEIDFIRASLQEMIAHYENGDFQSAYATARTAYLDSYEYVEIPLRPIAPDFTLEVEYQFAELRNLIKKQAPSEEIREVSIQINRNLDESERLVTGSGDVAPWIAFSASFSIIFREGLEAILIIGAVITYLEASRNYQFKKYIHYGIILAMGATAATWFVASYLIEISGTNRELIEAVAALLATGVLFYVSFWILNKIEHKKWMEFVKAKVWQATTTGSVMVFVMLSFFTVYREGFETVLFYQAMFSFAKYMETEVGLGFIAGIASLLAIYFAMRKLGRRLPLRILFGLTMGIGAYLSIAFLGNAIREFQVLDLIPYTSMIGVVPRLDINMATMTGIYPTLETVIGQIALLSVYLAASAYILVIRPRKEKRIMQMRKSRGTRDGQP